MKKIRIYRPKVFFEKIQITLVLCALLYGFCFVFTREIETLATFPGIFKAATLYTNDELDPEIIQVIDKKWNTIQGIYVDRKAKKTIYYFHGNGESLPYFYRDISFIANLGYNVMAFDYQGYGVSEGFPYEEDLKAASESFYRFLKIRKDFDEKDIIVWGYSVGTAVAIDFAKSHKNIDRIVLMSALSSRYDMSQHILGFPLQSFLGKENSFVSFEAVRDFDFPAFIIHGTEDAIVPFWQGKKVFENYKWEKYFLRIDGAEHDNIIALYNEKLRVPLRVFLAMDR